MYSLFSRYRGKHLSSVTLSVLLCNGLLLLCGGFLYYMYPVDSGVHLDNTFANSVNGHWLGTDHLGRDLLSLLLVGTWRTLATVGVASIFSFTLGTTLGLCIAYFHNPFTRFLKSLTDLFLILPSLICALILTSIWGIHPISAGVALGLFGIGHFLNHAEALTRQELAREYLIASRLLGAPWWHLLGKNVLPNILPELLVNLGNTASTVVLSYAALTFIGLGTDVTQPDWGALLYEYRSYFSTYPHLLLLPALCIFWLSLSLQLLFDKPDRSPI